MPIIDLFKRVLPKVGTSAADSDGPVNVQTILEDFSSSLHAPIPVADQTEADQIASAAPASAFPLFVFNQATVTLDVMSQQGAAWDMVGGRPHGLTATLYQTNLPNGVVKNLGIGSITRQTEGWALSSDNVRLTVPSTGLYLVQVNINVSGDSQTLGRVFTEFEVEGQKYRTGSAAEDQMNFVSVIPITAGSTIATYFYHSAGGTRSVQQGMLTVVQTLAPRWKRG
ncbi:hypothetical protein [Actinobaculum sp. 352]|uniref:hypothetical protein n=1 Tax=Actinobaculum sp. 352 TaxID=2490946 RepID=UPI000F7F3BC2|nr:hypothetical protein [Actinobaculum sp. 352]RTE47630.1 hypothetical protein EKN07_12350 [Actinobaculum sp. 352]